VTIDVDDPDLDTLADVWDVLEWWDDQDLTTHQKTVKQIYHRLRYETDLSEWMCRDYAEALDRIIVDGEDPDSVPDGSAAIKHAEQVLESTKTSEDGGNNA
jgi:hypothetical protein